VVVLNFLNERNHADRRVYELLDQKLKLFRGVFGASDEVLGAIGSGVDFERRILEIYQSCRTPEEIDAAFNKLQEELAEHIQDRLAETRRKLLEHFDDEVRARLKRMEQQTREELGQLEAGMLVLLQSVLGPGRAQVEDEEGGKRVWVYTWPRELEPYLPGVRPGAFWLGTGVADELKEKGLERLHLDHPLMRGIIQWVKAQPRARVVPVELLYTEGGHKITPLEPYRDCEGFWFCFKAGFEGLEREEHLVHIVYVHDLERGAGWQRLPFEVAEKFPTLTSRSGSWEGPPLPDELREDSSRALQEWIERQKGEIDHRNLQYLDEEYEKLYRYIGEAKEALEVKLEKIQLQQQEMKRQIARTPDLKARMELRKRLEGLEKAYYHQLERIRKEERRLYREKEKRMQKLERRAELRISKELVGVCHWRLR